MKDLENLHISREDFKFKKLIGFILAITTIGLTALMFVMMTEYENQIEIPICPHGFDC